MSSTDAPAQAIERVLEVMMGLLIEKNKRYGNSALKPLRIFARRRRTRVSRYALMTSSTGLFKAAGTYARTTRPAL
jgi:hypothetical protein